MLPRSFKAAKCKTSLKLAVARIKLLRNKREVQLKQLRRELAQLLENGQDPTARIRVEHVIREEKTKSAYELIELYCELIVARLPIIESQKSCPIDLKEAVCSIIFASPRCADVPELMDIRKHFAAKYGKDFINSALEIRPDCGVSRMVIEKLSAMAPDTETKIKTLTAISQEHNVKWNSKSFEEQLQKSHDDLLNGPTAFTGPRKDAMKSTNVNSSRASTQANESSMTMTQHDTASTRTPGNSAPVSSQSETRRSERRPLGGEVNNSKLTDENASLNRPTWSMEFQNATAAAQAAAESAERASMAARVAAELARYENLSSQNSSRSNESPTYNKKYERPEKLRVFLGEQIDEEFGPMANDELKSSIGMKTEEKNLQHYGSVQGISRREAGRTSNDHSSQDFDNDDILNVSILKNDVKDYGHAESISSESGAVELNHLDMKYENVESGRQSINVRSSKVASSHDITDDQKLWNSDIYKHDKDKGETLDVGEISFESHCKCSTYGVPFAAVCDNYDSDNYDSDAEDNSSVLERNRGRLLDSYLGEDSSSFQFNKGPFSNKSERTPFAKNSGSQLHLFTEHSDTISEVTLPFPSDDSIPPAFDDSDGESTENENEVVNCAHKEAMRPGNILHDPRCSTSPFSDDSIHESDHCIGEMKVVKEAIENSEPYEPKVEVDLYAADKLYKRSDSDLSNSAISSRGPGYSSTDEEEPQPLCLTKRQPTKETETKEKSKTPSMHVDTGVSDASNDFRDKSEQGINFGRLTGGFRHKDLPRPPYERSSATDNSGSSKRTSGATSITKKPIVTDMDKQSVNFAVLREADKLSSFLLDKKYESSEVRNLEQYDQKPCTKACEESSSKIASLSSDNREAKLDSNYTATKINENVKLSRRTGDVLKPIPDTTYDAAAIHGKGNSKPIQSIPSAPSMAPTKISSTFEKSLKSSQLNSMDNVAPTNNESAKSSSSSGAKSSSSSGKAVSNESSLKKSTHTHPKLPDYESFAAHFHSLRSNQQ